jgi:hypothetical protein
MMTLVKSSAKNAGDPQPLLLTCWIKGLFSTAVSINNVVKVPGEFIKGFGTV